MVLPDGGVRFHIYLDGGSPTVPAHIMKAELIGTDGHSIESWNTDALTRLPPISIRNDFAYNKFMAGPYGLVATMGAQATVALPPAADVELPAGGVAIKLIDVNGRSFTTALAKHVRGS